MYGKKIVDTLAQKSAHNDVGQRKDRLWHFN